MRARPHTRRPVRRTVRRIIHRSHISPAAAEDGQPSADAAWSGIPKPAAVTAGRANGPNVSASPGPAPRRPAWF
jgi:hypothetical protein